MPASRLRLRIALGFAVVFAAALAIFAAASVTYLRRESERRLDGRLGAVRNAARLPRASARERPLSN